MKYLICLAAYHATLNQHKTTVITEYQLKIFKWIVYLKEVQLTKKEGKNEKLKEKKNIENKTRGGSMSKTTSEPIRLREMVTKYKLITR